MKQKRFLSMFALLLMAATGTWAQEETLLTTITPTGDNSYSETTTGVVTVTISNVGYHDEDYGWVWWESGSVTVEAKEGYTITRCVFRQNDKTPVTITTSPFAITFNENGNCDQDLYVTMNGVTSIEVYGPAAPATTYSVTLAEGTEDGDKWTVKVGEGEAQVFPVEGLNGGETVTATYSGDRKVKSVKAVKKAAAVTDLATITADYEAKDGETLTGTLASNVKISIADGATVTLKDVNITNLGNDCDWAGISCPGDATLVLEGTNTVCAGRGSDGYNNYPGIWIAPDKTLTIQGDGTLTAYSNDSQPYAAGIGGGYKIACGNIVINSGTITATGGYDAAGIGGGQSAGCGNITINGGTVTATGGNYGPGIGSGAGANYATCGNITISGGTVEATGGSNAAGIGGGNSNGACGTITITKGVTSVKVTKGEGAPNSIGKGNNGQDITVNIEDGANVIMTVTLTPGQIGNLNKWNTKKTINGITIEVSEDAQFNSTGLMLVRANDPDTGEQIPTTATYTFTTSEGKIKRIDINNNGGYWWNAGAGWPGNYDISSPSPFTWSGTPAASVTLNGSCDDMNYCSLDVTSIVITLE